MLESRGNEAWLQRQPHSTVPMVALPEVEKHLANGYSQYTHMYTFYRVLETNNQEVKLFLKKNYHCNTSRNSQNV